MNEERSSRPIWLGEDLRQWDHVRVHIQLLQDSRIGAYELAAYVGLAAHAEIRSGQCRPGIELLAKYMQCSEKTARNAVRALEDAQYITIEERPGKANRYALLPPPALIPTPVPQSGVQTGRVDSPTAHPSPTYRGTPPSRTDEQEPITRTRNERAKTVIHTQPQNQDPGCGACMNGWVDTGNGDVTECPCRYGDKRAVLERVK